MKLTENTKVKIRVPKHLYEAIQAELGKKHMEEGDYGHDEPMEEDASLVDIGSQIIADPANAFEILKTGLEMSANELKNFLYGLGTITGVGGGAIIAGLEDAKFKKAEKEKASAAQQTVGEEEVTELEEVLDMETLLEAVNDAAKKKKEKDAKKKAEDKKKKEAEDKKKKEAAKKDKKPVNELFGFGGGKHKPNTRVKTKDGQEWLIDKFLKKGDYGDIYVVRDPTGSGRTKELGSNQFTVVSK